MRVARVVLATMLLISFAGFCAREASGGGTNDARDEGIKLYQAGHYEEALLCFDQVLARHARDLEIRVKRGACYLQLNKPENALADFDFVNRHQIRAVARFRTTGDLRPQLDLGSDWVPSDIRTSTSRKAGATAASHS